MPEKYLKRLILPTEDDEFGFFLNQLRVNHNNEYPFKLFTRKIPEPLEFGAVTMLCGSNGSGKSTVLNIIAEKLGALRRSAFCGSPLFPDYLELCDIDYDEAPGGCQILTSDDIFDYMLNVRYLNNGIDVRRVELISEYISKKNEALPKLRTLADYDEWKKNYDATQKTASKYVGDRLAMNAEVRSNGENAMRFFTDHITENTLYLLDEPENSMTVDRQEALAKYISDSARHFACQFVIATHSPVFAAIADAKIYDFDRSPIEAVKWTELQNVRKLFLFFDSHREEF